MSSPKSHDDQDASRPALETRHSSSFHGAARAVAAAHRFTTGGQPSAGAGPHFSPPGGVSPFGTSPHTLSPPRLSPRALSPSRRSPPNRSYGSFAERVDDLEAGLSSSPPRGASSSPTTQRRNVHFTIPGDRDGEMLDDLDDLPPQMRGAKKGFGEGARPPRYHWLSSKGGGTGDEPGVDVKSKRDEEAYGGLKGDCHITVVDYSSNPEDLTTNLKVDFDGVRIREFFEGDEGKRPVGDDGKPSGVRWINVEGLNWEVIKFLTIHFGLHPLAVEDALRSSNSPRSKLDFYKDHLYLQILVQHMHPADSEALHHVADAMEEGYLERWMSDGAADAREEGFGRMLRGERPGPSTAAGADAGAAGPTDFSRRRSSLGAALLNPEAMAAARRKSSAPPKRPGILTRMREAWGSSHTGTKMRLPEGVEGVFEPSLAGGRVAIGETPYSKAAHRLTVDQLSAKYMVPIRRGVMSMFMTRDGTIITITRRPIREVLVPIYGRLEDEQSLLRKSGDASMLAEALLDTSVDLAIEISQTFEAEILKLEASVLVDPQMETVRHLHVLSSQLIRLRRSLTPLLHVIYIIRDQDTQRSAAASAISTGKATGPGGGSLLLSAGSNGNGGGNGGNGRSTATDSRAGPPAGAGGSRASSLLNFTPSDATSAVDAMASAPLETAPLPTASHSGNHHVSPSLAPPPSYPLTVGPQIQAGLLQHQGFFSPMTKVYIGDVLDHLEIIVSSMDQFVATCDHLTDYVFNALSFQTNASMERLSIVTVIFLPLTFISSYFGMNFTSFDAIQGSVAYFWQIAIPCTFSFFIIFSFGYIRTGFQTVSRRLARWQRTREVEERVRARRRKVQ